MKYYNTLPQEQETIINIDYFNKTLKLYTSRKSIIERMNIHLGKAEKEYFIDKALTGAEWRIPFEDKKKISIALSKPKLIGQLGSKDT